MNVNTLFEVLDFEVDINMVVKEDSKNLGCSDESKREQSEMGIPDNNLNRINVETTKGSEDISDRLGNDSNSTKIQESSGSEAGEIDQDDSSTKELEKLSGSEAGEIDQEEPCDVEDGEISDCPDKKVVCKFFLRGCCYYGSQCQFLHVCNEVYKMFDSPPLSTGSKNTVVPSFSPQIPPYPIEEGSSWEKGLETAKAMIKDSIKKRTEDKEFDNKRLYISPEIPKSQLAYPRDKKLKSKSSASDQKAVRSEPIIYPSDTQMKKEKHSTPNNMYDEYKWVDPWMRSNKKDSKSYATKKYKKRHCSISSASSLDDFNTNPSYKQSDRKSPRRLSVRSSCCRSYSRSRSRSQSSSRTNVSYSMHSHSRKNSPSYRKSKRRKIRRSSSLEKWFKKEVSAARHSRSPSCSSLDSYKSYESSMTISSLTCSNTSSCSSSYEIENSTRKDSKPLKSKFSDGSPRCRHIATAAIENIKNFIKVKQKNVSQNQKGGSPKHPQVAVPEVKSSVKLPPKKNNPAVNELLRYANIKPKAVTNRTSDQQALKIQDLDSSTSDCKGLVPTDPRRHITLNLQTPKLLKQKVPEVQTKHHGLSEASNKEVLSKKESLLKQLKLVEQAIARKKNSL